MEIMRRGPVKLYIVFLMSSIFLVSDSCSWSRALLGTVMVSSSEKFPSETLSRPVSPPFLPPPPPHILYEPPLLSLFLTPAPVFFFFFFLSYFTLSFSLLLFLLGWEEVTSLFLDPWGKGRWSSLSCNPFFIRPVQHI